MNRNSNDTLLAEIVNAIEEVKGQNITLLDLRELENTVCDHFVIADGSSNTQVSAIARSIEKLVGKNLQEKPWRIEGEQEAEWILMDYVSIVVHVFQKPIREKYDIESLWGDAKQTVISSSVK